MREKKIPYFKNLKEKPHGIKRRRKGKNCGGRKAEDGNPKGFY
jgi:hypothetical protein